MSKKITRLTRLSLGADLAQRIAFRSRLSRRWNVGEQAAALIWGSASIRRQCPSKSKWWQLRISCTEVDK